MRSARRLSAVAAASALALTACSGGERGINIGIRQTALDLEFKVAKLAKPVPREVITRYLPAPPPPTVLPPLAPGVVAPPIPSPPLPVNPCPAAPFGAVPDANAALKPDRAPLAGAYPQRMLGSAQVTVGSSVLTAVLPPAALVTVGKAVTGTPTVPDQVVNMATAGPEYDQVTKVSDTYTVTERFRISAEQIELVKRVVKDGTRTTTFTPTPTITFYKYGGEGTTWTSAGADLDTGRALVVQGTTGARQRIDLCGKLVDTYSVTLKETLVDVQTGEQITASDSDPSSYNIATQYGGVIVKRHVHETSTRKDEETGEDVKVVLNYTVTANALTPDQPGA